MILTRINRTDPERLFIVGYNSYATASLTNGQAIIWDYATDADGVGMTKPTAHSTTHDCSVFAGVVAATIASGSYGLIQTYGYHSAVRMRSKTGGAPAVAAGQPLAPVTANFCLESFMWSQSTCSSTTKVIQLKTVAFALAAQASWTTKAVAAFIKAM